MAAGFWKQRTSARQQKRSPGSEGAIDILLLDLDPDAAKVLAFGRRVIQERAETRVVLISNRRKEHLDLSEQLGLRAAAFLQKPFVPKDLFAAIATITSPS